MKYTSLILITLIIQNVFSQNFDSEDWLLFADENVIEVVVSESDFITVNDFRFVFDWDNKLTYSGNIGYYGGIKTMQIYYKDEIINTFSNIEDVIALGEIRMNFYDYNMDGHLDFTIPISEGKTLWRAYYLFNPILNKFENYTDWDYLNIQKINKETKQILSHPDGNAFATNRILYEINGFKIQEIKDP